MSKLHANASADVLKQMVALLHKKSLNQIPCHLLVNGLHDTLVLVHSACKAMMVA